MSEPTISGSESLAGSKRLRRGTSSLRDGSRRPSASESAGDWRSVPADLESRATKAEERADEAESVAAEAREAADDARQAADEAADDPGQFDG